MLLTILGGCPQCPQPLHSPGNVAIGNKGWSRGHTDDCVRRFDCLLCFFSGDIVAGKSAVSDED